MTVMMKKFSAIVHVTAVCSEDNTPVEDELYKKLLEWEVRANTINNRGYRDDDAVVTVGIRIHLGKEMIGD